MARTFIRNGVSATTALLVFAIFSGLFFAHAQDVPAVAGVVAPPANATFEEIVTYLAMTGVAGAVYQLLNRALKLLEDGRALAQAGKPLFRIEITHRMKGASVKDVVSVYAHEEDGEVAPDDPDHQRPRRRARHDEDPADEPTAG